MANNNNNNLFDDSNLKLNSSNTSTEEISLKKRKKSNLKPVTKYFTFLRKENNIDLYICAICKEVFHLIIHKHLNKLLMT